MLASERSAGAASGNDSPIVGTIIHHDGYAACGTATPAGACLIGFESWPRAILAAGLARLNAVSAAQLVAYYIVLRCSFGCAPGPFLPPLPNSLGSPSSPDLNIPLVP